MTLEEADSSAGPFTDLRLRNGPVVLPARGRAGTVLDALVLPLLPREPTDASLDALRRAAVDEPPS